MTANATATTRIDILIFDGVDELDAIAPYRVLKGARWAGADFSVRLVTLRPATTVTASYRDNCSNLRSPLNITK